MDGNLEVLVKERTKVQNKSENRTQPAPIEIPKKTEGGNPSFLYSHSQRQKLCDRTKKTRKMLSKVG